MSLRQLIRQPRALRLLDWLVAAALSVDVLLEALIGPGISDSARLVTAVFAVALVASVAVRRRWPAGALVASSATLLLQEPLHGEVTSLVTRSFLLAPVLLSYGAGAWLGLRRSIVAISVASALWFGDALAKSFVTHTAAIGGVTGVLQALVYPMIFPWLVGRFVRNRHQRADAFRRLATQVAAEQDGREREAIAHERLTIGRELQDIIAHDVSVMVIQAAAARRLIRTEPDSARNAILAVEMTGREALAEMRQLLGVLRKDDDPRALTPQPGLEQLDDLTLALRKEGLECSLETDGRPTPLTPGIDLVGYRAIEAALRGGADGRRRTATTSVRYAPTSLEIEVRGDTPPPGLGAALDGVSERVRLYGGELHIGDASRGDLWMRCRLPLTTAVAG